MGRKLVPVIVLLLGALGLAWAWQRHASPGPDPDMLRLYGNIDIREIQLAFNGSEHLDEILVEEGARVTAGQVLARLHRDRLQAAVAAAEARLAAQSQRLAALEAGTRPEEIDQARAALSAARADARAAERSYRRIADLAARQLASQERFDEARAQRDAALAHVEQAQATLALAEAGPRTEDIAAARAQRDALAAELALARQQLADAELKAPADGIIRDRILEPGDFATPQTPVLTLARTEPVWVRAFAPEPALGRIRPGLPARVHSDSFPERIYRGWVGYISPTAEFTPKTVETPDLRTRLVYRLRIPVCNPDGTLRLGMPVTVDIDTSAEPLANPGDTLCHAADARP